MVAKGEGSEMATMHTTSQRRRAGLLTGFLAGFGSMAFLSSERPRPVVRRSLAPASSDRTRIQGDFSRVLNSNREFPARG